MATAYDIMFNLKKMFGEQSRATRQVAMKVLLNTKMAKGTPVQDHVRKMIAHLNELEILGAENDGKTQVNIVLILLQEFIKNFRLNYFMSKRLYTLAELLKELQIVEGIIGKKVLLLLQRRVKGRKMFQSRVHSPNSRIRLAKAS